MNNKEAPQNCEAELCCKATAALNAEVAKELEQEDKAIAGLLKDKEPEPDENQDNS